MPKALEDLAAMRRARENLPLLVLAFHYPKTKWVVKQGVWPRVFTVFFEPADFLSSRKMLIGITRRAEAHAPHAPATSQEPTKAATRSPTAWVHARNIRGQAWSARTRVGEWVWMPPTG
ncbi:MAG: hypothetical protein ACHQ4F_08540 [Candidatus Dormibacteria bacterium]